MNILKQLIAIPIYHFAEVSPL